MGPLELPSSKGIAIKAAKCENIYMRTTFFVQKKAAAASSTPATVPESLIADVPAAQVEKVSVYTTSASLKAHIYNLGISLAAVIIMAALQSALSYMQTIFPDISTGAGQIGAAFAAVKLLGR